MEDLKYELGKLVHEETIRANAKYGPIASLHEGESVLREEVEEVFTEYRSMKRLLDKLWKKVKKNDPKTVRKLAMHIRKVALNCAAEAIQVACVATRLMIHIEEKIREECEME